MRKASKICGLDEAGRGALAGPLVCAGVCLPESFDVSSYPKLVIKDSKQLTLKQRETAREIILAEAEFYISVTSSTEIDNKGINWANKHGFLEVLNEIQADRYIVDGNIGFDQDNVDSQIKADELVLSVSCASILAKTTRDRLMRQNHLEYMEYGFDRNFGYGTQEHITSIVRFGKTKIHRRLFVNTAIKNYLSKSQVI